MGHGRRLAALGVVEQQRDVRKASRDRLDLAGRLRRLNKQRVGTRFAIQPGAVKRGVESLLRPCVRAGDDQELARAPSRDRGRDFRGHLRRRDHLLALQVTAFLRHDLVLKMNCGNSRRLELANGPDHVDRISVTGVRIRDHRYLDGLHDPASVVHHLRERQQSDIRPTQQ